MRQRAGAVPRTPFAAARISPDLYADMRRNSGLQGMPQKNVPRFSVLQALVSKPMMTDDLIQPRFAQALYPPRSASAHDIDVKPCRNPLRNAVGFGIITLGFPDRDIIWVYSDEKREKVERYADFMG